MSKELEKIPKFEFKKSRLFSVAKSYLQENDLDDLERAFNFAQQAHEGQMRKDGTPFFTHVLAVAEILVEYQVDLLTLQAALLHDTVEDTFVTRKYLEFRFGKQVSDIVFYLSKVNSWFNKNVSVVNQFLDIENFWLTSPQIVLIKLADRLHNIQTIEGFGLLKRQKYLIETENNLMPLFVKIFTLVKDEYFHQKIDFLIGKLRFELETAKSNLKK
jgi:GTP pyrophosphokinase